MQKGKEKNRSEKQEPVKVHQTPQSPKVQKSLPPWMIRPLQVNEVLASCPPPLYRGTRSKQPAAAFGADSNAVAVRTEIPGFAVPPVWYAMSHYDSHCSPTTCQTGMGSGRTCALSVVEPLPRMSG